MPSFLIARSSALSSCMENKKTTLQKTSCLILSLMTRRDSSRPTANLQTLKSGRGRETIYLGNQAEKSVQNEKTSRVGENCEKQEISQMAQDPNTIYMKLGLTNQGPAAKLKNDPLWRRVKGNLTKEKRENAW
ncbi:hypothetical protein GQ600_1213 [Phytophthora cactorum]|nr:hypothetical protein GQ600_1213 [Phytophthora cactorum]